MKTGHLTLGALLLSPSCALQAAGLAALLSTCSGCSLIGASVGTAVGASTGRYDRVELNDPAVSLSTHNELRVRIHSVDGYATWVDGYYDGVRDDALLVSNDDGQQAIPLGTIRELRVRRGTYWGMGFWVGLGIGATIDLSLAAACSNKGCGFGPN